MGKSLRILAVFDFDHTLIDLNTDVEVQKLSPGGKLPPEVKELRDKMGWTEFMQQVFIHLNKSRVSSEAIKKHMRQLEFTEGVADMLKVLKDELQAEIIIISDSNTLFISELLDEADLSGYVKEVFTHPAHFDDKGCLQITRLNPEVVCPEGKGRMCKGHILQEYLERRQREEDGIGFDVVAYIGDGLNDFHPVTQLRETDFAFVRQGFALEKHLRKTNCERTKCSVIYWNDIRTVDKTLAKSQHDQ